MAHLYDAHGVVVKDPGDELTTLTEWTAILDGWKGIPESDREAFVSAIGTAFAASFDPSTWTGYILGEKGKVRVIKYVTNPYTFVPPAP